MTCQHFNLRYTIGTDSLRLGGGRIEQHEDPSHAVLIKDVPAAQVSIKVKCMDCHRSYTRPANISPNLDEFVKATAVTMALITTTMEV